MPKKLLLGLKDEEIIINKSCEHYFVPTNYKHIEIDINQMKNIYKIIITDKLLDSCEMQKCSPLSNICQGKNNNNKRNKKINLKP